MYYQYKWCCFPQISLMTGPVNRNQIYCISFRTRGNWLCSWKSSNCWHKVTSTTGLIVPLKTKKTVHTFYIILSYFHEFISRCCALFHSTYCGLRRFVRFFLWPSFRRLFALYIVVTILDSGISSHPLYWTPQIGDIWGKRFRVCRKVHWTHNKCKNKNESAKIRNFRGA